MDFEPNFHESYSLLSGLFPENPPKSQPLSLAMSHIQPPPSQVNPPLMFPTDQNFHHFQHYPHQLDLNGSNPNPIFLKDAPSSSFNIPFSHPTTTLSFDSAFPNGPFKIDAALHGGHSTGRAFWDFSNKLSLPSDSALAPHMGPSLSPLFHQAYGSPLKPKLQDELFLFFPENNNNQWEHGARADHRDDERNKKLQMRKSGGGILKNTNIIKGQWTPEEDRSAERHLIDYVVVFPFMFVCFIFFGGEICSFDSFSSSFFWQDVGAIGGAVWDEEMVTSRKGSEWKGGKAV